MHIYQAVLPFPQIDPVLVRLGPFPIRWYAIAYIAGLLLGWWAISRMLREADLWKSPTFGGKPPATADDIGDLFVWTTFGVIIGGRLGWVLFYGTLYCGFWGQGLGWCSGLPLGFLTDPLRIVEAWKGGMSFHGGLLGVAIALWLFCRRRKLDTLKLGDLASVVAPIGLFFGRIANFINGELWGKVTDVPWAMVFPNAQDGLPRHPSQLYEAALEGIVLLIVMQICLRVFRLHEKPGLLIAIFLTGYGLARFFVEFFRDSESKFIGWFSMGMALSIPLWIAGAIFFWIALRREHARVAAA